MFWGRLVNDYSLFITVVFLKDMIYLKIIGARTMNGRRIPFKGQRTNYFSFTVSGRTPGNFPKSGKIPGNSPKMKNVVK